MTELEILYHVRRLTRELRSTYALLPMIKLSHHVRYGS